MGEWYIATDGNSEGAGTLADPWDIFVLETVNNGDIIQPGDTVYIRGGTYVVPRDPTPGVGLSIYLQGTSSNYITLRPYPGEHVIIDGATNFGDGVGVYSEYLIVTNAQGAEFEFVNTDWTHNISGRGSVNSRWSDEEGSHPPLGATAGGFYVRDARNIKFRNIIVHDLLQFAAQLESPGPLEIYGVISYNCGWIAPDRGHGHSMYLQNLEDNGQLFDIEQCAMVHSCGSMINNAGSGHIAYNIHFTNCIGVSDDWVNSMETNDGISNIILDECHLRGKYCIHFQDWDVQASDYQIINCIIYGKTESNICTLNAATSLTFTGNKLISYDYAPIDNILFLRRNLAAPYFPATFDNNEYYVRDDGDNGFRVYTSDVDSNSYTFPDWKTATGYDSSSTIEEGYPDDEVFIYPNAYETGRGMIVVYNWTLQTSVDVSLTSMGFVNGDTYEIRLAWDYLNDTGNSDPITGTYTGADVAVDLQASRWDYARMIGGSDAERALWPAHDEDWDGDGFAQQHLPQFGVFIVRKTNGVE